MNGWVRGGTHVSPTQHAGVKRNATCVDHLSDHACHTSPTVLQIHLHLRCYCLAVFTTAHPASVLCVMQCLQLVVTLLTAEQMSKALKCLAQQRNFKPTEWWLVKVLAVTHSRVTEFSAPAAASTLWAAAKLTQTSAFPSEKWVADFSGQFWDHVGDVQDVRQLGQGLWGSVVVGFRPSEDQWKGWEAAAARYQWKLPLAAARDAVQGYREVHRPVPSELLDQLQREWEVHKARQAAEVAAAEAARREAAAQLALQQQRMMAAQAAIAQHQAAQKQRRPSGGGSNGKAPRPKRTFKMDKQGNGESSSGSKLSKHQAGSSSSSRSQDTSAAFMVVPT